MKNYRIAPPLSWSYSLTRFTLFLFQDLQKSFLALLTMFLPLDNSILLIMNLIGSLNEQ